MKSKKLQRRGALRQAIWQWGTQHDFAAACDMHDSYLSEIVNGWRNPTEDDTAVMCRVLGLTARKLGMQ
jgi:plasmid maintenance system antidote protein VapI